MTSFSKPKPAPSPFIPINRSFLHGLTIGYHDGPPPAYRLARLNDLGVPLLCRLPVTNQGQAQLQLDALLPYPNLVGLVLVENETTGPQFTIDHAKMWGVQFFNETDIYGWSPQQFADMTWDYYRTWRNAKFTKNIVTGGIFSVESNYRYLGPLLAVMPRDTIIDVHWYGDSSDSWKAKLQALTAGFRVSVSEYGKPSRTPMEHLAQAAYYTAKHVDWHRFGATFACAYQAASGPTEKNEDNFGLWSQDGTEKPALATLGDGL